MKSPMSKKKPMAMKSILGPAKSKAKPTAAAKKPAKKKAANDAPAVANGPVSYREPKSVRITAAENGMTVSTYTKDGEQIKVAKSVNEAMRHCKDMLK
jgi:predicted lipoprotein with Yx(FWY)xxD motif